MEQTKTKAFNVAILRPPTGGARRSIIPNEKLAAQNPEIEKVVQFCLTFLEG